MLGIISKNTILKAIHNNRFKHLSDFKGLKTETKY